MSGNPSSSRQLRALERQIARLRQAVAALIAITAATCFLSLRQAEPLLDVIRCRGLVIVDKHGAERIRLRVSPRSSPRLEMLDKQGALQAELKTTPKDSEGGSCA